MTFSGQDGKASCQNDFAPQTFGGLFPTRRGHPTSQISFPSIVVEIVVIQNALRSTMTVRGALSASAMNRREMRLSPRSGIALNGRATSCNRNCRLRDCWRAVCENAKLGMLRLHDLRHTAPSHAVMAGENLRLVGEVLGPSDTGPQRATPTLPTNIWQRPARRLEASSRRQCPVDSSINSTCAPSLYCPPASSFPSR